MPDSELLLRTLLRRGLLGGDLSNVTLHFEAAVLDRYRGTPGYSLIRTDTVGRLRREGGWSLDLGIAADATLIHAFAGDLLRLPDVEREHWAAHAVALPMSAMFVQMRMAPGSCFDDGEVRKWD